MHQKSKAEKRLNETDWYQQGLFRVTGGEQYKVDPQLSEEHWCRAQRGCSEDALLNEWSWDWDCSSFHMVESVRD